MKPSDFIKRGWCQQHLAKDINGIAIDPCDKDAVCWCAMGAIIAAETDIPWASVRDEFATHINYSTGSTLPTWNDDPNRTQQEVIDVFEAIGL